MPDRTLIVPVILSGGSGTRLWPMSTPDRPKQFLALTGSETMFQLTVRRTGKAQRFAPPLIVANARHAELVEAQLAGIGVAPRAIILEPCARNTAPAIALAAITAGDSPLLVMPSDHLIGDEAAFLDAVRTALPLLDNGWLVTFGITPSGPETGYGYIAAGEPLSPGARRATRFIEKPERARAEEMLATGGHFWNGGIFLFRAQDYLDALAEHAPAILEAARDSIAEAHSSGARILPGEAQFASCPSDSIDYAVMEKAAKVAVVPVSMEWSDIGSWDALYAIGLKDDEGNCVLGDVRLSASDGTLIRSDGLRVSASGLKDMIIIASGSEVMILPRGSSQDARKFSS